MWNLKAQNGPRLVHVKKPKQILQAADIESEGPFIYFYKKKYNYYFTVNVIFNFKKNYFSKIKINQNRKRRLLITLDSLFRSQISFQFHVSLNRINV